MFFTEREWLLKGAMACAARIVDEGFVAKVGWRNALLLCVGMVCRENGDEWLGINGGCDQAIDRVAVAQKAGVESTVLEAFDDHCSEGLVKMKADAGIRLAVFAEDGGKDGQHGRADEANMQRTDFAASYAARLFDVSLDVAQCPLGAFEKDCACAGKRD